jgi:hypothetical protein
MLRSLLLVLLFSFAVAAQGTRAKPCKLSVSSAPTIRTLQLSQTFDEIKQRYAPLAKIEENWYGQSEIELIIDNAETKPVEFENLDVVYLKFLDSKLYKMEFGYHDPAVWWGNVRDFASQVSRMLKIPNMWVASKHQNNVASMNCGAVWFEAAVRNGQPRLALIDGTLMRLYESRLRTGDQQRRGSFHP